MSFSRRLGRILRAQLGALRAGTNGSAAEDVAGEKNAHAPRPSDASSAAPVVPPAVAAAYRALEVPVGSDRQTVKKSYRRLMRTYHPDRFAHDTDRRATAHEVAQRLNAAYEQVDAYLDGQAP